MPTVAVMSVFATSAALLVFSNLTSNSVSIRQRIAHSYEVRDPQFARVMTSLLGPPLLDGNRVTPLQNGEQAPCSTATGTSRRSSASGRARAQVFRSSGDEGSESTRLMYLLSIAAARRSLRIAPASTSTPRW